jgi:[histone H3]-trimethyl-L-lysine4 demethylase
LNYLDQLSKFHKQNGGNLNRFPSVDKRPLDLYKLKKAVETRGGFEKVCKLKKWAEIGRDLGYSGKIMSSLSTSLKNSYQKWLHPYEEYLRLAKPGVQQQLEYEYGASLTPTQSPMRQSHQPTPTGLRDDSPAIKSSTTLNNVIKAADPDAMEVDSPVPRPTSGFTAVNHSFTAANSFQPVNAGTPLKWEKESSGGTPQQSVDGLRTSMHSTPDVQPNMANGHGSQKLKRTISHESTNGLVSGTESPANGADSSGRRSKRQKKDSAPTVAGSHMSLLRPLVPRMSGGATRQPPSFQAGSKPGERCEGCGQIEEPSNLVICDSCDNGYHRNCTDPPIKFASQDWHCPKCLVGTGEFGFEEGGVYGLRQFQEKANNFKESYFGPKMPFDPVLNTKRQVTEDEVEREFWRLVESLVETVEVEYGADIHSTTHGSGFPEVEKDPLNPYARDPWNLNILPLHPDSLFRHIKSDISGMTVPWLYVGMVFSTFCWHNEDHYTYSANYQHFGATKTWYGIPGEDAERFEQAMKQAVPELFEQQPDLLFQLVTLLPPDQLRKAGVNVYALDQRAGQFVITFPQAYHAGFNHGFNFNEAVNFAPSDWEPFGQAGVERLQEFRRQPCFSHEELLITAAARDTTIKSAKWLAPALKRVYERETAQRKGFLKRHMEFNDHHCKVDGESDESGIRCGMGFESDEQDLQEEEYQCAHCKAYAYLSRYQCRRSGKVMCMLHAGVFACCDANEEQRHTNSDHILRYRISDEELKSTVQKVDDRARQPEAWQEKLDELLENKPCPPLKTLRSLVSEGERIPYDLPGLADLKQYVDRCNEWIEEAANYTTRKQQNRRKNDRVWRRGTNNKSNEAEDRDKELRKIENIHRLLAQADELSFDATEIDQLREKAESIEQYREQARVTLLTEANHTTDEFEAMADLGRSFNVDIPEVEQLENMHNRRKWKDEAEEMKKGPKSLANVDALIERSKGFNIPDNEPLLVHWREQKEKGEIWERKARELMGADAIHYHQLEALCNQANVVPVTQATKDKIDSILAKQREAHRQILAMYDKCKDPDFRKRPKYKDVRTVLDSISELNGKPSGTVDLEKEVKRHEDWMRKGKKLFGKTNAPLHILMSHMTLVRDRNVKCLSLKDKPRMMPAEPASREPSPVGNDNAVFCLCRHYESGTMIECDICHEWYVKYYY